MSYLYKSLIRLMPLALIIVFIIGIIGPGLVRADPGWYDTNWQYRKKITINSANVTGNLSNFPVLISIVADSDIGSHAQLNGDDILFTKDDEVTKIPHEIESFSSNGATANLTAWVKITNLSSTTDTDIYIYYGYGAASNQEDPTNVWDNYVMVSHMKDDPDSSHVKDSTGNGHNGTKLGANEPQETDGKIAKGQDYDATNDDIAISDVASLQNLFDGGGTFEIIGYPNSDGELDSGRLADKSDSANEGWTLSIGSETGGLCRVAFRQHFSTSYGTWIWQSPRPITISAHNHIAIVYDASSTGNDPVLYVNGVAVSGQTEADTPSGTIVTDAGNNLHIGNRSDTERTFDGILDELRISNTMKTADWIATSYNNQNNPSDFFTLGSEQTPGPIAVGGKVLTVNKALVLAPWILIAIALCIVIFRVIQHFRKKVSSRSPTEKTR